MIKVGLVYKSIDGEKIKIACDFYSNGKKQTLWYQTSIQFEDYISLDTCNPFFLMLFIYAFHNQEDIEFETPVSKRLYYGVVNYLQEIYLLHQKNHRKIDVKCKLVDFQYESKGIATAMSLGVDSFYSLFEKENSFDEITHLMLFNAGAFGQYEGEISRRYFNVMKDIVQDLSDELSLPLLWVDTNFNEAFNVPFGVTCIFRNIACSLLFEKKIGVYYYSNAVPFQDMQVFCDCPEDQELVQSFALSTESQEIRMSGLFKNRVEKTDEITNFDVTKKYLNVCIVTSEYENVNEADGKIENCSKCFKCRRTMVTLDILGKLSSYNNVFDLNHYNKHREKYLADTLYHYYRSKEVFSVEIMELVHENKFAFPLKVYYYLVIRSIQPILKFLKFK